MRVTRAGHLRQLGRISAENAEPLDSALSAASLDQLLRSASRSRWASTAAFLTPSLTSPTTSRAAPLALSIAPSARSLSFPVALPIASFAAPELLQRTARACRDTHSPRRPETPSSRRDACACALKQGSHLRPQCSLARTPRESSPSGRGSNSDAPRGESRWRARCRRRWAR